MAVSSLSGDEITVMRERVFAWMSSDGGLASHLIAPSHRAQWSDEMQRAWVEELVSASLEENEAGKNRVLIREATAALRRAALECRARDLDREGSDDIDLLASMMVQLDAVWDLVKPDYARRGALGCVEEAYACAQVELLTVHALRVASEAFLTSGKHSDGRTMFHIFETIIARSLSLRSIHEEDDDDTPPQQNAFGQRAGEILSGFNNRRGSRLFFKKFSDTCRKYQIHAVADAVQSFLNKLELDDCWIVHMHNLEKEVEDGLWRRTTTSNPSPTGRNSTDKADAGAKNDRILVHDFHGMGTGGLTNSIANSGNKADSDMDPQKIAVQHSENDGVSMLDQAGNLVGRRKAELGLTRGVLKTQADTLPGAGTCGMLEDNKVQDVAHDDKLCNGAGVEKHAVAQRKGTTTNRTGGYEGPVDPGHPAEFCQTVQLDVCNDKLSRLNALSPPSEESDGKGVFVECQLDSITPGNGNVLAGASPNDEKYATIDRYHGVVQKQDGSCPEKGGGALRPAYELEHDRNALLQQKATKESSRINNRRKKMSSRRQPRSEICVTNREPISGIDKLSPPTARGVGKYGKFKNSNSPGQNESLTVAEDAHLQLNKDPHDVQNCKTRGQKKCDEHRVSEDEHLRGQGRKLEVRLTSNSLSASESGESLLTTEVKEQISSGYSRDMGGTCKKRTRSELENGKKASRRTPHTQDKKKMRGDEMKLDNILGNLVGNMSTQDEYRRGISHGLDGKLPRDRMGAESLDVIERREPLESRAALEGGSNALVVAGAPWIAAIHFEGNMREDVEWQRYKSFNKRHHRVLSADRIFPQQRQQRRGPNRPLYEQGSASLDEQDTKFDRNYITADDRDSDAEEPKRFSWDMHYGRPVLVEHLGADAGFLARHRRRFRAARSLKRRKDGVKDVGTFYVHQDSPDDGVNCSVKLETNRPGYRIGQANMEGISRKGLRDRSVPERSTHAEGCTDSDMNLKPQRGDRFVISEADRFLYNGYGFNHGPVETQEIANLYDQTNGGDNPIRIDAIEAHEKKLHGLRAKQGRVEVDMRMRSQRDSLGSRHAVHRARGLGASCFQQDEVSGGDMDVEISSILKTINQRDLRRNLGAELDHHQGIGTTNNKGGPHREYEVYHSSAGTKARVRGMPKDRGVSVIHSLPQLASSRNGKEHKQSDIAGTGRVKSTPVSIPTGNQERDQLSSQKPFGNMGPGVPRRSRRSVAGILRSNRRKAKNIYVFTEYEDIVLCGLIREFGYGEWVKIAEAGTARRRLRLSRTPTQVQHRAQELALVS